jgi:putative PEP-CTERM system TPR-repeat lipoprotein
MKKWLAMPILLASFASANVAMATETDSLETVREYLNKGENKAAVIELKNFLRENPEHAEARLLMGEAYLKLGDGLAAAKAFEKARDLKAPKDRWIVSLGRAYLLQNDAKSVLDYIQPDPDLAVPVRARVYGIIGMAYLAKGDPAKARESFDAALKLDPDAGEALLGLAMAEGRQKRFGKAAEYAGQVLARDQKNLDAWIILGEAKRLDGDAPGAVDAFGKALQVSPADIRARLGRATSYLDANRMEEASQDVAEVRKTAGDLPQALYLEAVIDFERKKIDEAWELLTKVTNVMPEHWPGKLLFGAIAYQKAEFETAERELSQFLAQVPDHIPAAKLLAATRMKQGRPAEAIDVLKGVEGQAGDDAQFLALFGSAHLEAGQFDLGSEYLSRAAELDPKAAAIKAQLAVGRMAAGRLDEAVGNLKAAVDLDRNLLQADVMLVLALLQERKYDEAIETATRLKGKMKDDPLPENLLGAAHMARGNADKAREHWRTALRLKPEYAAAALNLAKLELSRNNPEAAVQQYKNILEHDSGNPSALIGLAQVAESRKDYDRMEKYLAEAREKNPQALQPALMLSRYYLVRGRPLRALEIARDAESHNPGQPLALQSLAVAQMANGQAPSAAATFRKLVNKAPANPEHRHQLAQALYKSGDRTSALQEWRNLARAAPDYVPAYLAQAELALQDGKYDEALEIAEAVKARLPESPAGPRLEGDVHFARKQYEQAAAAYEKALQLESGAASVHRLYQARRALGDDQAGFGVLAQWLKSNGNDVVSWMILAAGYQSAGRPADAVAAYEKAYALQPDNVVIQNNLAWLYQELGDGRALALADKLLPASENNPEIMDTVGWIYVRNDRLEKGLALLQDAAVHSPRQAQIRIHIAHALIKAGRKEEARKELDALLKDNKDFAERRQAEDLLEGL